MLFLRADLSLADARVYFALSKDPRLIEIARKSPTEFDVHKFVGSLIFGEPEENIKGEKRQVSKKIGHGCHAADTQVLTLSGWKWIGDVYDEPIAVWGDGRIWFEAPKRKFAYPVQETLLSFYQKGFNWAQTITSDHRVPYRTSQGYIRVTTADGLRKLKRSPMPISGLYSGGLFGTEDFGRFIAAVQADGSFSGLSGTVRFHFHKERKFIRIQKLASRLGFRFKATAKNGDYRVTVYRTSVKEWLPDKCFTSKLLELSPAALDGLLDELKYWDGSNAGGREVFYSTIVENVLWVQTIAHLRGRSCSIGGPTTSDFGSVVYRAALNRRAYGYKPALTELPYTGLVYCFETSTGFFLVRHKNRISVSGNSAYDMAPDRMSDTLIKDGYFYTPEECAVMQARYHAALPAIREGYQFNTRMLIIRERKLVNSWGRVIYFRHERFEPSVYRRGYAWRAACCDDKTEVLTTDGFVPFPELRPHHKVAQWNNGLIQFVTPKAIHAYRYCGPLLCWENRHASLAVTPNHRMIGKTGLKSAWSVRSADEFKNFKSLIVPVGGEWDTEGITQDAFRLYQANSLTTDLGSPAQEHYYDGWVYCVTVPSGFFLIRRNGKVSVTGNSEVADILNQWGFIPLDQFIERNNLKSRINMQVHDEVLVSVTRDEAWDIARFLRDSIEREREYDGINLKMPVTFAIERRYHTEEVEFKRLPDDKAEWDAKFDPLWETRIK
jgi:hypothetical protein